MKTVAVVQARLGSSRLPGKVMFPIGGKPVIFRIIQRLEPSSMIDEIVVATTEHNHDTVISTISQVAGASTFEGAENDVLGRVYEAASEYDADSIVRICADTPFISYRIVDPCVEILHSNNYDYVTTKLVRTFPIGYGAEVFSMNSFEQVNKLSEKNHEREHVTVRYRENNDSYSRFVLTAEDFFDEETYQNRVNLRLTLDEPADYHLIKTVYEGINVEKPTIEQIIDYIDENKLSHLNNQVEQKSMFTVDDG